MKTKIEIKKRWSGTVLFEFECETLLDCLKEALKSGADLSGANLRGANLIGANLIGANLDYSVMQFHCNHLKPKTDRRLRVQLAFHLASWMKHAADDLQLDEKALFEALKPFANEFHRKEVERI